MVSLLLLLGWDLAVRFTGTRLIPPPRDVAIMLWDFSFGGVYDDAFSKTIHIHFWKSVQRVYGGFLMAAAAGIPLGLLIGRVRFIRELLDPTLQLLRPVPVTAWLPLSMIFFGLGPRRIEHDARIALARPLEVSAFDFNQARREITQRLTSHVGSHTSNKVAVLA